MDKQYEVTRMETAVDVAEYYASYVDPPRFLAFCSQCSAYGKVWSCPPYDFSVEDLWQNYGRMLVLGRKLTFAPELCRRRYDRDAMQQLLADTLFREREDMERELFEMEAVHPGSIALLPGSCHRCGDGNCSRTEGLPCRDPQHLRHSLESLGGDVGRTAEELLGFPLLWSSEGRLPPYLCLVAALLLP